MLVLGIETSSKMGSLALVKNGKVLGKKVFTRELGHSEKIVPAVDEILKKTGVPLRRLQAIAVGIGPGSYTGLRVGVAAAKGFSILTGIPVIGIPSVDALVLAHETTFPSEQKWVGVAVDAKREESYLGEYLRGRNGFRRRGKIRLVSNEKLTKMREQGKFICGPELNAFFPTADAVARLGERLLKSKRAPAEAEPIYLRPFIPIKSEHQKWTRFVAVGRK